MKHITLETLYTYDIEKELTTIQLKPIPYPLFLEPISRDGLNIKGKILWSGNIII